MQPLLFVALCSAVMADKENATNKPELLVGEEEEDKEEEEDEESESPLVLQSNSDQCLDAEEKISLLDSNKFTGKDSPHATKFGGEEENEDEEDDDKSLLPEKYSRFAFLDCCGVGGFIASYRTTNPQKRITPFAVVLLLVLLLLYVLNQADRLVLAVMIPSGLRCNDAEDDVINSSSNSNDHCPVPPITNTSNSSTLYPDCIPFTDTEQGLLTGPAFVLVYVISGLPLAYLADTRSRPVVLLVGVGFWSVMVFLMGFVNRFWELLLLRVMLGIGEVRERGTR